MNSPSRTRTLLSHAGAVAVTVARHVVPRGLLWAVLGLVLGGVCVAASFVVGVFVMGRGAILLGYLAAIPFALALAGAPLFGVHGLSRGAARAALELERKAGLTEWLTTTAYDHLVQRVGGPVSNLPLAQLQTTLRGALDQVLGTDEGGGITGWVLRTIKRRLVSTLETYLLEAYRAEFRPDGTGGGVSLEKLFVPVRQRLASGLADTVMAPLNKHLALISVAYVLVAGGWWFWLFLILRLITRSGH